MMFFQSARQGWVSLNQEGLMMRSWLLANGKYRIVGCGGVLTAALVLSACSSTPQQIYQRSSPGSGQALVVLGIVKHDVVALRARFTIVLDEYSPMRNPSSRRSDRRSISATSHALKTAAGSNSSAT
jgi:hypothetical protein